jgi:glycerophosphoryl diester phosphodiesterase
MKLRSVLAAAMLAGVLATPIATPVEAVRGCPVGAAHRGNIYYGSPIENSMAAFRAAFATGARWVETDIQMTSDQVPVLMHDDTVDRTTKGTGKVSAMTAAQFKALVMEGSVAQHPPTLADLLALLRQSTSYHASVEVKRPITASQEKVVGAAIRGLESKVQLQAFAPELANLQHLKKANPALNVSLNVSRAVLPIPAGMNGENLDVAVATPEDVAKLRAARPGFEVRVGLANDRASWYRFYRAGVDGIITNKARDYQAWRAAGCPAS